MNDRAIERIFAGLRAAGASALLLAGAGAFAASGGGHGHEEAHEEVPTGAALVERCEEYAETLAFTREQLKRRTILGRWNFVKAEHRQRERFYDSYCTGDAHASGGHGDAHADEGHGGGHDEAHGDGHHG
jgi:hypothetical protein